MKEQPLILVTNDDGITAEGIHRLVDAVAGLGETVVVAPDAPRSGGSSSITCNSILRPRRHDDYRGAQMWSLNGTPADCVKLALGELLPCRPRLLVSGINHGSNTGNSVVYSGTMGAAFEGCMNGVDSIGYSVTTHHPTAADFDACEPYVRQLAEAVLGGGLPKGVCLNVNFPCGGVVKGLRRARACKGRWTEEFAAYDDPWGTGKFYLLTGEFRNLEPDAADTDLYWISQGYGAVVPSVPDRDYTLPLPIID